MIDYNDIQQSQSDDNIFATLESWWHHITKISDSFLPTTKTIHYITLSFPLNLNILSTMMRIRFCLNAIS